MKWNSGYPAGPERSVRLMFASVGQPCRFLRTMRRLTLTVVGDARFWGALADQTVGVAGAWDALNSQLAE